MPKSPEGGNFNSEESRGEIPEWIRNIKLGYSIYDSALEKARKEIGEGGRFSSEASDAKFSSDARWKAIKKFHEFLGQVTEQLPEMILLEKEEEAVRLDTNFGTRTYGNPYRRYYVPAANEIYRIYTRQDAFLGGPGEHLFPESPDFPGIEALKQGEALEAGANFDYLYSEPEFDVSGREMDVGRLSEGEIDTILKSLDTVFQRAENIAVLERIKFELAAMKTEKEATWQRLVHEHAEILKRRMQNLVSVIRENSRVRLPDRVDIMPSLDEDNADIFYIPAENKLVVVPEITRKNLLGKSVRSHDFKRAKDAPEKYWLQSMGHPLLRDTFPGRAQQFY